MVLLGARVEFGGDWRVLEIGVSKVAAVWVLTRSFVREVAVFVSVFLWRGFVCMLSFLKPNSQKISSFRRELCV